MIMLRLSALGPWCQHIGPRGWQHHQNPIPIRIRNKVPLIHETMRVNGAVTKSHGRQCPAVRRSVQPVPGLRSKDQRKWTSLSAPKD